MRSSTILCTFPLWLSSMGCDPLSILSAVQTSNDYSDICDANQWLCDSPPSLHRCGDIYPVCDDHDADGVADCDCDCDDHDPLITPGDADGDGFNACGFYSPAKRIWLGIDCNDDKPETYPGAPEICDGWINDCSTPGTGIPEIERDRDLDDWMPCNGDCNEADDAINPDAREICDDGVDNDCDGLTDAFDVSGCPHLCIDRDADGYFACNDWYCTDPACAGRGGPTDPTDCDDENPAVNHGVTEICDGVDNDCHYDELSHKDRDYDGDGFQECNGDCKPFDSTIHPDAEEVCDGVDNNCFAGEDDGGWVFATCTPDYPPGNHHLGRWLCGVNPATFRFELVCIASCVHGLERDCGDGLDNDCDYYVDAEDLDCFLSLCSSEDEDSDGITQCDGDCDDADLFTYPGAEEICDGADNNCAGDGESDGAWVGDACEVDGTTPPQAGVRYCAYNPTTDIAWFMCIPIEACLEEFCGNGADDDCDALNDRDDPDCPSMPCATAVDRDGDGSNQCEDCNDNAHLILPGFPELCQDGFDNDCDGTTDLDDSNCESWRPDGALPD